MEYAEENQFRKSQLPPSRLLSPGKPLSEMPDSHNNARATGIPTKLPQKRSQEASNHEPDAKRMTLAEQAGSFKTKLPAQTALPTPKVTSNIGAMKHSSTMSSFTSSTSSSRMPSVSSRTASNGSYASSVGPGSRSQSSLGHTKKSQSFSKSTSTRPKPGLSRPRPVTSMGHRQIKEEEDISVDGKGMHSVPAFQDPSTSIENLHVRKRRGQQSMPCLKTQSSISDKRDISISMAMSKLSIDDRQRNKNQEHQAISYARRQPPAKSLSHKGSISSGLRSMGIDSSKSAMVLCKSFDNDLVVPKTPVSQIPVAARPQTVITTPAQVPVTPCKIPKVSQETPVVTPYLTKRSNITGFTEWNVNERLENMENMFSGLKENLNATHVERNGLQEAVELYKSKIVELESLRSQLTASNSSLQTEIDMARQRAEALQQKFTEASISLDDTIRNHRVELDEVRRENRNEVDQLRRENIAEVDRLTRTHRETLYELERRAKTELEDRVREIERRNDDKLEEERSRRLREVQDLEARITSEHLNLNVGLQSKDREIQNMRGELEDVKGELDREQTLKSSLQKDLTELKATLLRTSTENSSTIGTMESTISSLRAQVAFLESGSKAQSDSFTEMERRLQEAIKSAEVSKQKLIKEETLRRILFNQVQELKGNIRVMCRVRPTFSDDENAAKISFPDMEKESKELELLGQEEKSALGNITRKTHAFSFDRVFGPSTQNQEVFEEISQLVQSALDGYNVCIFCYGQTGAGKTHTMSSADGMIPRATHQIYETATSLQEKGWTYTMEGSFVEVYNEEIHDLLGSSKDFDKKKHEIRHDEQKKQTTVTGLKSVPLDSPNAVESILKQADANRSVAATKSNERSSRSHSVFILKLVGRNSTTNETSEGTLNLVDLAGSERLKQSGAEGDRMKETQNINKSLSCLGDVIGALGQGKEGTHIPYRNSKLTYLLQYSLGGNSKTLMFVMVSPLEAHVKETLTSLKFATKVHNTHIGTAKKSTRVGRGSDT